MSQGKLVRDKIPQIIRSKGLEPVIYTASTEEYSARLRDKLQEEVDEFIVSDSDPEELADILEVLYASPSRSAPTGSTWRSCGRPRRRNEGDSSAGSSGQGTGPRQPPS
jgi:predicted house-cleaning noncanonical NTP pyrophosphatase (MazG superfamily)